MQADRGFLQGLKGYQDRVQLSDEVAEEVMREAARTKLERCLTTAVEAVKKRTRVRDFSPAIQVHMHASDFTSGGVLVFRSLVLACLSVREISDFFARQLCVYQLTQVFRGLIRHIRHMH